MMNEEIGKLKLYWPQVLSTLDHFSATGTRCPQEHQHGAPGLTDTVRKPHETGAAVHAIPGIKTYSEVVSFTFLTNCCLLIFCKKSKSHTKTT